VGAVGISTREEPAVDAYVDGLRSPESPSVSGFALRVARRREERKICWGKGKGRGRPGGLASAIV
jgi:hypothetical protein